MTLKEIFLAILVAIIVLMIGLEVTVKYNQDFEEKCDEKFGKGNWKLNETTGKYPFYIGQTWECVKR